MGKITEDLLDLMEIKWDYLDPDIDQASHQIKKADDFITKNIPFFFVVRKNTFIEEKLRSQGTFLSHNRIIVTKNHNDEYPARIKALQTISAVKDEKTVLLATTGKTGRELYEIGDTHHNLYMVGSLGCVSSMGLGLALVKEDKNIIVIDGDGSLLMRLGSMATNAHYAPRNMLHILLDNNMHDSTGGQNTVSPNVNFTALAASCGYSASIYIHNLVELSAAIKQWKKARQLTFLYVNIKPGSKKELGRPKSKPFEIKQNLMNFLAE